MTARNDVLVSDALLEDKFVTIWAFDFRNRFATAGHGSHNGRSWIRQLRISKMCVPVPIFINPGYRFATCQMELHELKLEHSSILYPNARSHLHFK